MSTPTKMHRYRIPQKDREYFTSNLALMMKAAVPLGEALASLRETSRSRSLNNALKQIEQNIDEGVPLHRALAESGVASAQTLTLVQFGEQSGNLVENLRAAAKQEEKQRIFRSKVRSALFYPGFVLVMTVSIGLGISWYLLPRLALTFAKLDIPLPFITKVFLGFGQFLQAHGIIFVPGFVIGLLVVGYIIFAAPKTKVIGQELLFHTPGIGKLLKEVEIARMGYLLGTLLNAGLSITQSLQLLRDSTGTYRYKKFYEHLYRSFDGGYGLRTSLNNYRHTRRLIPPSIQQMMITGEKTGSLSESLTNIGDIYEQQSEVTTKNLEAAIEPILLIVIATGVLGVAVGVIMPIYTLVGGLNK